MHHTIKIEGAQRIKITPDYEESRVVIDTGPHNEQFHLTLDQLGALLFALEETGLSVERRAVIH